VNEVEVNGIPVFIDPGDVSKLRFHYRTKPKPRGKDAPFSKLTVMQKQALTNRFELGMGNTQAASEAGYSLSNARRVLPALLKKKPIVEALEKKGIKPDKIAQVIAEGLDAMHPLRPALPDHNARAKFVREANTILDNYPPKKIQQDQRVIEIHLTGDDMRAIQKYEEMRRDHAG